MLSWFFYHLHYIRIIRIKQLCSYVFHNILRASNPSSFAAHIPDSLLQFRFFPMLS